MDDNSLSPSSSNQRKLPIPNTGANIGAALKGISIKPKRILPLQPDSQKLKRTTQEVSSELYKSDDSLSTVSRPGLNPSSKLDAAASGASSAAKVVVPKLQIDVDRLKSYFQLKGNAVNAVVRGEKRRIDYNENETKQDIGSYITGENETSEVSQSGSKGGPQAAEPLNLADNTLSNFSTDGLSKVKEWCSSREVDIRVKMTSEPSAHRHLERSIRSPSPKSSTTWDRSSSGYSSDERADPRSPPPSHSASVSVSSKTETETTNEDDVSMSHTDDADVDVDVDVDPHVCNDSHSDDGDDSEQNNELDTLKATDDLSTIKLSNNSNSTSSSADDLLTTDNDCSALTLTPTPIPAVHSDSDITSGQCDNCDALNNTGSEKSDTASSCVNFSFDNPSATKKRPVGTALPNPPGNGTGRIQYKKSLSESVISLRLSGRQAAADTNFDGLEVCGKSFPQPSPSSASTLKSEPPTQDTRADVIYRPEASRLGSAFTPVEKPVILVDAGSDVNVSPRPKIVRPPLATCRSPRDFRPFSVGEYFPLIIG